MRMDRCKDQIPYWKFWIKKKKNYLTKFWVVQIKNEHILISKHNNISILVVNINKNIVILRSAYYYFV